MAGKWEEPCDVLTKPQSVQIFARGAGECCAESCLNQSQFVPTLRIWRLPKMTAKHNYSIMNNCFNSHRAREKNPTNIYLLYSLQALIFSQPGSWQLRWAASKQPIFLTVKGKFLDNSLLSWKGELFFLILQSECALLSKQQLLSCAVKELLYSAQVSKKICLENTHPDTPFVCLASPCLLSRRPHLLQPLDNYRSFYIVLNISLVVF